MFNFDDKSSILLFLCLCLCMMFSVFITRLLKTWPAWLPAEGAEHPGPCWVAWPNQRFMSEHWKKKTPNWRWMRLSLQFKKVLFSKAKPSLEIRQGENPDIQMLTGWSTIFSKKLRSSTWLHVSVSVLYHQYHPILVETPDRRAAKAWNSCRKNPDLAGELQNLNLFGAS